MSDTWDLLNEDLSKDSFESETLYDVYDSNVITPTFNQVKLLPYFGRSYVNNNRDYKNYTPCHSFPGEIENRIIQLEGLDPKTTFEELLNFCSQFGDVLSIDMNNISSGKALVTFYDIRSAIYMRSKINGRLLNRHILKGKYASFPKVVYSKTPPNEGTIVIFHLPPNISTYELGHFFEQFGDIKQIRDSPKSNSQKFIEYFDIKSAQHAKEAMNGQLFGNSKLIVDYSRPGGFRKVENPAKVSTPIPKPHIIRPSKVQ